MTGQGCSQDVRLSPNALGALMPMYLQLDCGGRIVDVGPTLDRVGGRQMLERAFFDVFEVRRPRKVATLADLQRTVGGTLHLRTRAPKPTAFRAVSVSLDGDCGHILMNLSFGIHVSEAVAQHGLTIGDFAATDLAVEMLYLIEAKSVAMEESRKLNLHLERARMAAEQSSLTDPLTGLPNRRGISQIIHAFQARGMSFALMLMDLDYFKEVNDTLGHAAGDAVLVEAASRFQTTLRDGDVVARLGGDEFLALLPFSDDLPPLEDIGDRLIAGLSPPIMFEGEPCRISASIGATISSDARDMSLDDILREADAALYASKEAGRGRITLADWTAAKTKTELQGATQG